MTTSNFASRRSNGGALIAAAALVAGIATGCAAQDDPLVPAPGGDDPGDPGQPGRASISGTIQVATADVSAAHAGTPLARLHGPNASQQGAPAKSAADFIEGEVIVRFRPAVHSASLGSLHADGVALERTQIMALPATAVYLARGAGREKTLELARELHARDDVLYAHPNYRGEPFRTPNDPGFPLQWHYAAINLPQAWDRTIGSGNVVVGVVDSGILFDAQNPSLRHPDLASKVVPGFDFISDPQNALDGDGRDGNPFDEGSPVGQGSYHGSHVAGTIAASTEDNLGVAGVDWSARILPIRVLGPSTGSFVDIFEGMMWAAGIPIPGLPQNPNPASIINMSLGGEVACPQFAQDAIDAVLARGAIVVVAAGNENQNASGVTPAGCSGVITVGATGFADTRAPYSNFGSRIDVMAPGGDSSVDLNRDGQPDGVLSLTRDDSTGQFSVVFQHGTSMAAPHVAGAIALMKSIEPDLTAAQALAVLRATARPLTAAACNRPAAFDCGAGLIDVAAALAALDQGQPPPQGGAIVFNPDPADLGAGASEIEIALANPGTGSASWRITGFVSSPDNPVATPNGGLFLAEGADAQGIVAAGGTNTTRIGVDRSFATQPGTYAYQLVFDVNGVEQRLLLRFNVVAEGGDLPRGPMIVAAFIETAPDEFDLSGAVESDGFLANYSIEVAPGDNWMIAWSDDNGNGEVDNGDFVGTFPQPVQVSDSANITGIDFAVSRVVDIGSFDDSVDLPTLDQLRNLVRGR